MLGIMPTFGELARQPAPRSFWRARLQRRTGGLTLEDYLVDEANLRGHWGAFRRDAVLRAADPTLSLEEIVVGLLAPQATAEARHLKLVLRMLQSGRIDGRRLWALARREKAEDTLRWLLDHLPPEERSAPIAALIQQAPPQRAPRPPELDYDFRRLIKRPATARDLWNRAQRRS